LVFFSGVDTVLRMKVQKKKSKRLPLRQKYKVERKVREHKRQVRKDARLNPAGSKLKKDPGIPNLWPFKEQMLERLKAQQERAKDDKVRSKEIKKQEKAKSLRELMRDAQERQHAFQEKERNIENVTDGDFNKLPEHSKRAYYKEFKKVVEAADVILEVLDARDPIGTRAKAVEQMIQSQGNKKIILVLNKIDLVPREVVEGWLKYLRNEFPTIAFKCCTTTQRNNWGQSSGGSASLLSSNDSLGVQSLIQLLKNYSRSADIKTSISVGIIGYPNVGKSSLINSLNRSKAVGVGATPGFTKVMQEVQLDKKVKLLDCPGIVFASGSSEDAGEILLRNCVRIEKIEDPIKPIEAILKRCKPSQLMVKYKIPAFSSSQEFLCHVARRRGKLLKGGVPDYVDAARIVLTDWNSGQLPYFTIPPAVETKADVEHHTASIVSSFSKEFDLEALLKEADNSSLTVLPSIASTTEDAFVQLDPGASLDSLFSKMLTLSEETKDESSDDEDDFSYGDVDQMADSDEESDGDEDNDSDDMEDDEPVPARVAAPVPAKPVKKALDDAEAQLNPQRNQNIRKQMKKNRKLARREKAKGTGEAFDFSTDFVADNDVADDDLLDL